MIGDLTELLSLTGEALTIQRRLFIMVLTWSLAVGPTAWIGEQVMLMIIISLQILFEVIEVRRSNGERAE